ncbi:hypothetical protein OF83DRAFT_1039717, partial [Amylostereum chailletii]
GHLVRAILVPLTSDMLAARQAGGFSSATSHHFCTCCGLDINDIENIDKHTWPRRSLAEYRKHAEEWRDAESEEIRQDIFNKTGIRWSPLLDLDYYDPISFTVVEPMHALDLGLLDHHIR